MKTRLSSIFLFLLILSAPAFAGKIDSLTKIISTASEDTAKVSLLNQLSKSYFATDPDKAIEIGKEAQALAEKLKYKPALAIALKQIGIGYYMQGKYLETLDYWEQSLQVFEELDDKNGQSNILNNIGSVYYDQLDFEKALDHYLQALRLAELTREKLRMASVIGNIGNVYANKEKRTTWDKAIEYYKSGLNIGIELKTNSALKCPPEDANQIIGTMTVGIGEVYMNKGDYKSALDYFEQSLKVYEGTEAAPYSLNDIGKIYTLQNQPEKAIEYHQKAYDQAISMDLQLDMAQSLIGLAKAKEVQGNLKEAVKNYLDAEKISAEVGFQDELKFSYEGLAKSYSKIPDYQKAFKYQSLLSTLKDSLYNIATDKKVASLQFDFDISKKQGQIDLLTKDQALKEADLRRQKIIKNATIGGLAVVLLFLLVVFRQKEKDY
ncbi:MAG: tetratricopeptide repeat protein [Bacteroidetes bacterium]|nr:tetratricopeptide repeat protein [Bacteroidota bacterium]